MQQIKITTSKYFNDVDKLYDQIIASKQNFDFLYPIPRGGCILATALSKKNPLWTVLNPQEGLYSNTTLVVDDLIDSGKTLDVFDANFPTAVLYRKSYSPATDYHVEELDGWIDFWYETTSSDIEDNIRRLIQYLGENPLREGLHDTPKRVVKAFEELTLGYKQDPKEILSKQFDENHKEMVIVKNIPLYSMCEHHMLPFIGEVAIGYIPNGKIVGLSKLARLVNCFARRFQVQERLTSQIADSIMDILKPEGCMVVIEARHLCMEIRGAKAPKTLTMTSAVRGVFGSDTKARSEFLSMIKGGV